MIRRGRALAALSALLVVSACGGDSEPPAEPDLSSSTTAAEPRSQPEMPVDLELTDVATGLDTVWALAFAPDGSLHFTERRGRVGRMPRLDDGSYGEPTFQTVEGVVERGEAGLMGLAIDREGRRYVMYTASSENRIARLSGDSQTVLVDGIEAGAVHDGGRLAFGPDGFLYATTGDAGDRSLPRRDGLNGRVLRIDPESGAVEVFTTGHRNAQGLCFTEEGILLATEHGPDRGDELNVLRQGQDYGWPETVGTGIANWTPTIAPAGCVVYGGELIESWKGDLLFTTLKDGSLWHLELAPDLSRATSQQPLLTGRLGRLRDIAVGPDGALYLATSNRDGRGEPRPNDDRIVRAAA